MGESDGAAVDTAEHHLGLLNALRILGLTAAVASIRIMAQQAVTALDGQSKLVIGLTVASIVGFVAYFALIPHFGGAGAASGLLIGETIVTLWVMRVLYQHDVSIDFRVLFKAIVCGVATICILIFIEYEGGTWIFLAALGGGYTWLCFLLSVEFRLTFWICLIL